MRTGGDETRRKILEVAERLFSEKGFDGTSVGMIADAVGINKGLIYYHFKNKDDIVASLFANVIDELSEHIRRSGGEPEGSAPDTGIKEKMRHEITFLESKKRILSVMLMEAFKEEDQDNFLLRCAEIYLEHENEGITDTGPAEKSQSPRDHEHLVFEFFTGFIPVIAFVAMRDKWCSYYRCDSGRLLDMFLDSFERTHLAAHGPEAER